MFLNAQSFFKNELSVDKFGISFFQKHSGQTVKYHYVIGKNGRKSS